MIDGSAQTFGLPPCLLVPIAAASVGSIETYVGAVVGRREGRRGRANALCIEPYDFPVQKGPSVRLWQHPLAQGFEERLHPARQVWVHVAYAGYRNAYVEFGMPEIPNGYFLDHVQNREAVRLSDYAHPFSRLCPVSPRVNTSGGSNFGGEGMEKEFLRSLPTLSDATQTAAREAMKSEIVYADPMDLTKMLDVPPGTGPLPGVAGMLKLYYPE
ncbi:MAG: hypothetical protein PVI86_04795 [Phycisphaerae bacterium]|jgi:hypothetical protein